MKKKWLLQEVARVTATLFMLIVLLSSAAFATAEEEKSGDKWNFSITPYVWLPTISGSMKFNTPPDYENGNLDVTSNDYLDNLSSVCMIDFQAKKGKWSILSNILYVDFSKDDRTASFPGVLPDSGGWTVDADTELQATVFELVGAYSVFQDKRSNLDLLAGLRYADIDGKADLNIAGPLPDWVLSKTYSASETFFDPIIGFKGRFEPGGKWYMPYYFDIGGFGIDSDLTLQAFAGIGYRFCSYFSMVLGYRYLYYDFGDNSLVKALDLYGTTLGFSFSF